MNKLAKKSYIPQKCLNCNIYPACYGPCAEKYSKVQRYTCLLDNLGLSKDEYILFNFRMTVQFNGIQ